MLEAEFNVESSLKELKESLVKTHKETYSISVTLILAYISYHARDFV